MVMNMNGGRSMVTVEELNKLAEFIEAKRMAGGDVRNLLEHFYALVRDYVGIPEEVSA
jgi:hypothetical protein